MAYGIDDIVQQKVEAYRSNPQQLQQRYQQNQELLDLLALQKIKSEKDAAARDMQMKMQQQPGTIKQQLEQQLVEQTKQDLVNQTKGVMDQRQQRAQQNVQKLTQGIGGRPGTMRMAQGGIVGYAQGSSVNSKAQGGISPEEFEKYVQDIKDKEHFKGQAYQLDDHKGGKEQYYTIGYGDYGPHVKSGDTIDEATAEQRLRARLRSEFIPKARNMFPDFDTYSPELRRSLIQSIYRGGITGSPETRRLMNRGEFAKAATEFLNNDEYRDAKSGKVNPGVAPRMEELAKLLQAEAAKTQQPAATSVPTPRARPEQPEENIPTPRARPEQPEENVPTPRARPTGIASIGAKTPFYGRDLPPNLQDKPKMESKRDTSIMEGIRQLLGITATDQELEPIIPSIIEMIKRAQKTKGYQEGGQVLSDEELDRLRQIDPEAYRAYKEAQYRARQKRSIDETQRLYAPGKNLQAPPPKDGQTPMEGIRQILGVTPTDQKLEPIIPPISEMVQGAVKARQVPVEDQMVGDIRSKIAAAQDTEGGVVPPNLDDLIKQLEPKPEQQLGPKPEPQLGPKTEPQLGSKSEDMAPTESGLRGILEQDIMRRMQGQRAPEVERLMKERDALLASRQKPGLMSIFAGMDPYARTFGGALASGLDRRNKILAEQFGQDIGRIGADISSAEALRDKGLTGGLDLRKTDLTEEGQKLKAEANRIAETTNRIAASSLDFSRKQTALNNINNSIARLNQQVQEEISSSLPLDLQMKSPGSYTEEDKKTIAAIANRIRARYASEIRTAEAARDNLAKIMGIDAGARVPENFGTASITKVQ